MNGFRLDESPVVGFSATPRDRSGLAEFMGRGLNLGLAAISPIETLLTTFMGPKEEPFGERFKRATLGGRGLGEAFESRNIPAPHLLGLGAGLVIPGAGELVAAKKISKFGPLMEEAKKYGSAEEFVKHSGIVPEWGTLNQWIKRNPFFKKLREMTKIGLFDEDIVKKADTWEMMQVLKDKPAYIQGGGVTTHELLDFARKNKLVVGVWRGVGDVVSDRALVVAKNKKLLDRVLNSRTHRELGLALGYLDIGVLGGGKPRAAKQALIDFYNQAVKFLRK